VKSEDFTIHCEARNAFRLVSEEASRQLFLTSKRCARLPNMHFITCIIWQWSHPKIIPLLPYAGLLQGASEDTPFCNETKKFFWNHSRRSNPASFSMLREMRMKVLCLNNISFQPKLKIYIEYGLESNKHPEFIDVQHWLGQRYTVVNSFSRLLRRRSCQ